MIFTNDITLTWLLFILVPLEVCDSSSSSSSSRSSISSSSSSSSTNAANQFGNWFKVVVGSNCTYADALSHHF